MITLDEAIKHAKEKAESLRGSAKKWNESSKNKETNEARRVCEEAENDCIACAEEHEQLAEWLEELKMMREKFRWRHLFVRYTTDDDGINKERYPLFVDGEVPADGDEIIYAQKFSTGYHSFCTEVNEDDGIYLEDGTDIEYVEAWMPLPQYERKEQK